ncbi:hypothetical protein [Histidinibacterium aquaticum]|uniref:Uncharacterized protein n=1 Tax=Histidinibacterium aquaticum TaxID=2613962 RepID=A0A5J5GFN9_9RHOB|nr:hypothetical protein [Histidinibacterium aquaticum]KAA9007026.1 hypothetical protein F3S47_14780 [Histidinibacterium aquaticum]
MPLKRDGSWVFDILDDIESHVRGTGRTALADDLRHVIDRHEPEGRISRSASETEVPDNTISFPGRNRG